MKSGDYKPHKDMPLIKSQRLKELLDYDRETGIFHWRQREGNNPFNAQYAGKVAGNINSRGYVCFCIDGRREYGHRLVWLYVFGRLPTFFIDHIDGNPSNNKLINLREADFQQNAHNRKVKKDTKTGFKGVTFSRKMQKYKVTIRIDSINKHLGYFSDLSLAATAYQKAALEAYGEFARFD